MGPLGRNTIVIIKRIQRSSPWLATVSPIKGWLVFLKLACMSVINLTYLFQEMLLKSCLRRMSDSIDKRFCLEVTVQTQEKDKFSIPTMQTLILQTTSEEDCKRWLDAMDGKETVIKVLLNIKTLLLISNVFSNVDQSIH